MLPVNSPNSNACPTPSFLAQLLIRGPVSSLQAVFLLLPYNSDLQAFYQTSTPLSLSSRFPLTHPAHPCLHLLLRTCQNIFPRSLETSFSHKQIMNACQRHIKLLMEEMSRMTGLSWQTWRSSNFCNLWGNKGFKRENLLSGDAGKSCESFPLLSNTNKQSEDKSKKERKGITSYYTCTNCP